VKTGNGGGGSWEAKAGVVAKDNMRIAQSSLKGAHCGQLKADRELRGKGPNDSGLVGLRVSGVSSARFGSQHMQREGEMPGRGGFIIGSGGKKTLVSMVGRPHNLCFLQATRNSL